MGEAPGRDEVAAGIPFTGGSGRLLTQCMNMAGIRRADCYITNTVKYRPPNNDINLISSIGLDLQLEVSDLINELRETKANVIVAAGNVALEALCGKHQITKWRGSILECTKLPGRKVIPILHPALILRQYEWFPLLVMDLMKIKKQSEFPEIRIPKRNFIIGKDLDTTLLHLDIMKKAPKLSLDIETNFMSKDEGRTFIKCVGLADSPNRALIIPMVENDEPYWSAEQEWLIWQELHDIFLNENILKVIQNEHFERECLYSWTGEIENVHDTIIMHHLMQAELRKSLALQTSIYTDEPYYKDDASNADYEPSALYEYNGRDCCVTYEIHDVLEKELKNWGMWEFFTEYQVKYSREMWLASHTGVKVDVEKAASYKLATEDELERLQKELNQLVGYEVNVGSTKQMSHLLYTEMKFPIQTKLNFGTRKRSVTTDETALERLKKTYKHPIFDLILDVREKKKLLSTYFKEFWDSDHRCRPNWLLYGTATGRISCAENVRGTGLNLQNQPKFLRDMFIADDEYTMVRFDLSQVESRFVAYYSQDPNMIKVFEDNTRDIHNMVASMVFSILEKNVTKDSPERQKSKALGHGANYLLRAGRFAEIAGISKHEAEQILNRYYTMFRLGVWHEEIDRHLKSNRVLENAYGRKRTFYGRPGDDLLRAAVAYLPQGSVGDHIGHLALLILDLYRAEHGDDINLLIQVHDELVFQVPDDKVHQLCKIINTASQIPVTVNKRTFTLPIDLETGKNWKDMTTYEEPKMCNASGS